MISVSISAHFWSKSSIFETQKAPQGSSCRNWTCWVLAVKLSEPTGPTTGLTVKNKIQQPAFSHPWYSWPACRRNTIWTSANVLAKHNPPPPSTAATTWSSSTNLRAYLRATQRNSEIYTTREIYGVQEARPDCPLTSAAEPVRAAARELWGLCAPACTVCLDQPRAARSMTDDPSPIYDFQMTFFCAKLSASLCLCAFGCVN